MAYYTKVLQADETVRYLGGLHWTIYRNAILLAVVAVAALIACLAVSGDQKFIALIVAGLFLLLAVVSFVGAWFVRFSTEIVVTDKRIIHKVGWIVRRTEEMNVTKVETVDVSQGIGGRIFDYGTVAIRGVGGGWEPLRRVGSPLELRNAIVVG
ncbi:MAG TPA: PH domain-containing protein [Rhodopila sp.]|jgi:membrane protein YdbS with pleckstrin-like domain